MRNDPRRSTLQPNGVLARASARSGVRQTQQMGSTDPSGTLSVVAVARNNRLRDVPLPVLSQSVEALLFESIDDLPNMPNRHEHQSANRLHDDGPKDTRSASACSSRTIARASA